MVRFREPPYSRRPPPLPGARSSRGLAILPLGATVNRSAVQGFDGLLRFPVLLAMDEQLEQRLRFLREAKAEGMPHSNRGLLDHLLGTRQLLVDWQVRLALCDAGLFHSVYGTEHYELKAVPLSLRDDVRRLIGDEAELLAWLFCMMRRETFDENLGRDKDFSVQHRLTDEKLSLTTTQFQDLVTMTFANTLEAFPRLSWSLRRSCRAYLRSFRGIAISAAQNAFDRVDARGWELWK